MLEAGQVLMTLSGRPTTPFPRVDTSSERKAVNTYRRCETWLMQNALDEARARGDAFNATWMAANLKAPSPSDKDAAEMYLFDWQPPVLPPLLKSIGATH
jgi:hypothetical protein